MIALYFVCLLIAIGVFLLVTKFSIIMRVIVAISVFILLSALITAIFAKYEDKPIGPSRVIDPNQWNNSQDKTRTDNH